MKPALRLLFVLLLAPAAYGQQVSYEIAFPNAAHHEAEVTAVFEGVPPGPLAVRMSRTSPGRYALHEFAKNVYSVRVTDGAGRALEVARPDLHQWDVGGHDGTVRFCYTLFGDRADGTYTGIDNTHAHLNMPATLVWARGLEDAPVRVTFRRPDPAWGIATQLYPTDDPETFTAPDRDYLLDSPTEISPFALRTWPVASNGRTYTIRLAVHHDGTDEDVDRYAEMAEQVVAEQIAVFGETPDYGPGTYTFIADYLPHVDGDGMEHRNSTVLASTRPLEGEGALRNLGTLSHEYFHSWNVERIRPKTLEPFDFEAANVSDVLWFAEGFTSYYTPLFIRRAGIADDEAFAGSLTGMVNTVLNAPGRRYYSAADMSRQAPFVDAAVSIDPQNKGNTFISYYTWGSALGLGLDLLLRTRFDRTLDDYLRAMWVAYGKPETPYTIADLRRTLADVAGDAAFADDFFDRYVEGHEAVDYAPLLAEAGFLLRPEHPGRPWLGARVVETDGKAVVAGYPFVGSPLYEAGLTAGDAISEIDGVVVRDPAYVEAFLAVHAPGDTLRVTFEQRGETKTAALVLTEDPAVEVVPFEAAGRSVTPAMEAFRKAWLGSLAGE